MTPKEIKKIREKIGLSQPEMARAMGLTDRDGRVVVRTWQKWEYGERFPNAAARQMMAALVWLKNNGQLNDFLDSRAIII